MNKLNIVFMVFLTLLFLAMTIKDISVNIINRNERAEWKSERGAYQKEINAMRNRRLLFNFYIDKVNLMERSGYDRGIYGRSYTKTMREFEDNYLLELNLMSFNGWITEGE